MPAPPPQFAYATQLRQIAPQANGVYFLRKYIYCNTKGGSNLPPFCVDLKILFNTFDLDGVRIARRAVYHTAGKHDVISRFKREDALCVIKPLEKYNVEGIVFFTHNRCYAPA